MCRDHDNDANKEGYALASLESGYTLRESGVIVPKSIEVSQQVVKPRFFQTLIKTLTHQTIIAAVIASLLSTCISLAFAPDQKAPVINNNIINNERVTPNTIDQTIIELRKYINNNNTLSDAEKQEWLEYLDQLLLRLKSDSLIHEIESRAVYLVDNYVDLQRLSFVELERLISSGSLSMFDVVGLIYKDKLDLTVDELSKLNEISLEYKNIELSDIELIKFVNSEVVTMSSSVRNDLFANVLVNRIVVSNNSYVSYISTNSTLIISLLLIIYFALDIIGSSKIRNSKQRDVFKA